MEKIYVCKEFLYTYLLRYIQKEIIVAIRLDCQKNIMPFWIIQSLFQAFKEASSTQLIAVYVKHYAVLLV